MRTYEYTTTKAFEGSVGKDHKLTADVPETLAEALAEREGGSFFPDEKGVIAKAVSQMMISAVHRAADWAEKEVKAGRVPTVEQVQEKVRAFRYAEIRTRVAGEGGAPKASTRELKAKVAAFDAAQSGVCEAALSGKFGATALTVLVETGTLNLDALRAAAEGRADVPKAVAALLAPSAA